MTPEYFKSNSKTLKKLFIKAEIAFCAYMLFVYIATNAIYMFLRNRFYFGNPYLRELFPIFPAAIFLLMAVIVGFKAVKWIGKNIEKKISCNCPHCGKQIAGATIVLATGNCPSCGKRVLDRKE